MIHLFRKLKWSEDLSLKNMNIHSLIEYYRPDVKNSITPKYEGYVATAGAICGDIIGSRYEFSGLDRNKLCFENALSYTSNITDDTIMMFATMETLNTGNIEEEIRNLLEKHQLGDVKNGLPFGNTTYAKNYRKYYSLYPATGYGSSFAAWAITDAGPYASFGNGSAMRVAPIGDYFEGVEDVILHAIASAYCTHNHSEGIKGAVVTAVCIWMGKHEYSKKEILKYTKRHYKNQSMIRKYTMKELQKCDQGSFSVSSQFAVPAAVACFVRSSSYEKCITNALSFEGDSDTICAIAGAIAAAYYGRISNRAKDIIADKMPEELYNINII